MGKVEGNKKKERDKEKHIPILGCAAEKRYRKSTHLCIYMQHINSYTFLNMPFLIINHSVNFSVIRILIIIIAFWDLVAKQVTQK